MPRDNFSKRVIERLRMRVAHLCSNPDCKVSTVGPGDGSDGVAHFGKAAHISAASAGGPRYLPSMSSVERSSFENGIWLCSNCATEIDTAPDSYPVDLLREWKRLAEESARQTKGKSHPCQEDARNQLVSALTGLPTTFMHTAIKNMHGATEQVLQSLDPRFSVETSYHNAVTTYSVYAKENVRCSMQIPSELTQDWRAAIEGLIDHGNEATVSAQGVKMSGSPLLERMFSNAGLQTVRLSVEAQKKQAVLKLRLLNLATQQVEQFDDVHGYVRHGRKSMTFEGAACGGILKASCQFQWERAVAASLTWTMQAEDWNKKDVCSLPYFDKLLCFFGRIAADWKIQLELEIEGICVLRGEAAAPVESDAIQSVAASLHYLDLVRRITKFLGIAVPFDRDYRISHTEHQEAFEIVEIIEERASYDVESVRSNSTCRIVAQDMASNIRMLAASKTPSTVVMEEDCGNKAYLFGQPVLLPRAQLTLDGVQPKIHHENLEAITDGEAVLVEWEPADGFKCSWRYLPERQNDQLAQGNLSSEGSIVG